MKESIRQVLLSSMWDFLRLFTKMRSRRFLWRALHSKAWQVRMAVILLGWSRLWLLLVSKTSLLHQGSSQAITLQKTPSGNLKKKMGIVLDSLLHWGCLKLVKTITLCLDFQKQLTLSVDSKRFSQTCKWAPAATQKSQHCSQEWEKSQLKENYQQGKEGENGLHLEACWDRGRKETTDMLTK